MYEVQFRVLHWNVTFFFQSTSYRACLNTWCAASCAFTVRCSIPLRTVPGSRSPGRHCFRSRSTTDNDACGRWSVGKKTKKRPAWKQATFERTGPHGRIVRPHGPSCRFASVWTDRRRENRFATCFARSLRSTCSLGYYTSSPPLTDMCEPAVLIWTLGFASCLKRSARFIKRSLFVPARCFERQRERREKERERDGVVVVVVGGGGVFTAQTSGEASLCVTDRLLSTTTKTQDQEGGGRRRRRWWRRRWRWRIAEGARVEIWNYTAVK